MMMQPNFRRMKSRIWLFLWVFLGIIAVLPVISMVLEVLVRGLQGLSPAVLDQVSASSSGGNLVHAIAGTIIVTLLTAILSIPIALMVGVYLAEYPDYRSMRMLRGLVATMADLPAVIGGLFAYALMISNMDDLSMIYSSLALSFVLMPRLIRDTEQILRDVPAVILEGALSIGATKRQMIFYVLLPSCIRMLTRQWLHGLARVMGETAPLVFTSFDDQAVALPLAVFTFAQSSTKGWVLEAWGRALLLLIFVSILLLISRQINRRVVR